MDVIYLLIIQWCECYARCDWSSPLIYQGTDTRMTSRELVFFLSNMVRGFENVCEIISD